MFALKVGDLVEIRRKAFAFLNKNAVGIVVEVKELTYVDALEDAGLRVATAMFGEEYVILAESDFKVVKRIDENS